MKQMISSGRQTRISMAKGRSETALTTLSFKITTSPLNTLAWMGAELANWLSFPILMSRISKSGAMKSFSGKCHGDPLAVRYMGAFEVRTFSNQKMTVGSEKRRAS